MEKKIGHYSFIGGVVIAVVLGLFSGMIQGTAVAWLTSLLVILGLIVGMLNVAGKETKEFLIVSAVLIIAAGVGGAGDYLSGVQYIGSYLEGVFASVLAFVIPATIIVALKDIWGLGQNPE